MVFFNYFMDRTLSQRIAILRFPLIVGVVFIHASGTTVGLSDGVLGSTRVGSLSLLVMDYVSRVLAGNSVPLFYLLSGFLFFYNFNISKSGYINKIKSRIHSIAIPYVFWNILMILMLAIAQQIPLTSSFFSGRHPLVSSFKWFDYLNAILGLTRLPIAYQFWFIRDLLIMFALVPLIYFFIKNFPYYYLAGVVTIWIFGPWPLFIPSSVAVCFFSIGAFLGLRKYNLCQTDNIGRISLAVYFALSIIDVSTKGAWYNLEIHKLGIIFGVHCAFYLTRYIGAISDIGMRVLIDKLGPTSFFVFSIHEPLLTIFKKLSYKLLCPVSDLSIITLYFTIPILVILICVQLYHISNRLFPIPTRIVTGGR